MCRRAPRQLELKVAQMLCPVAVAVAESKACCGAFLVAVSVAAGLPGHLAGHHIAVAAQHQQQTT